MTVLDASYALNRSVRKKYRMWSDTSSSWSRMSRRAPKPESTPPQRVTSAARSTTRRATRRQVCFLWLIFNQRPFALSLFLLKAHTAWNASSNYHCRELSEYTIQHNRHFEVKQILNLYALCRKRSWEYSARVRRRTYGHSKVRIVCSTTRLERGTRRSAIQLAIIWNLQ